MNFTRVVLSVVVALAGFSALAERETQGLVWVRTSSESELDHQVRQVAHQINTGQYRGHLSDDCGHGRNSRKVYGIDIKGKSYRADRYGNLHPQWTAVVKYRCR